MPADDAIERWLDLHGVGPGRWLAFAAGNGCAGLAVDGAELGLGRDWDDVVASIERTRSPRWVWWDRSEPTALVERRIDLDRCWDVTAVHRLLEGGWRTSPAEIWARAHALAVESMPVLGQLDLFTAQADEGDPDEPVRPDGHLRPDWAAGAWADAPERCARWAALALRVARGQASSIDGAANRRARSTAHAESMAEVLSVELGRTGLPIDVAVAEQLIRDAVGERPIDDDHAIALSRRRDDVVLSRIGTAATGIDLRNPADVRAMLRRVGVDLPDTRAWRLERHRDAHPVVAALLDWRKAERIATTYGYRWLDEHVHDGRLRGEWSSSDGAAGRMTATAGLHNLPGDLRPAIAAEPGHRFVRADLGQIEPRVLAAVSGDRALVAATAGDDLYQPVADRLGVTREIAKVAVLGAMYGATTGESAHALRGLERAYPVAMRFLAEVADAGVRGDDVATVGGRRIRMWFDDSLDGDLDRARRVAAARGRFARNAVIQGAAAELFKVWALVVRRRVRPLAGEIVLCLHDELLVHVPADRAPATADAVADALAEAAHRWSPDHATRFLADVAVSDRWKPLAGRDRTARPSR